MLKRFTLAAFMALAPAGASVAENACEDLWLARNVILDRGGHCFSNRLGRSVFNNGDCTRGRSTVTEAGEQRIAQIKAREAELNCSINTTRKHLQDVTAIARRHRLGVQPIANGTERSCLGYTGARVGVFAAPSPTAQQFGFVERGDDVYWYHDDEGAWSFVVRKRTGSDMVGWARAPITACTERSG